METAFVVSARRLARWFWLEWVRPLALPALVIFAKPLLGYAQATAAQLLDIDLYRQAILAGGGA